jgi:hypothetical protein
VLCKYLLHRYCIEECGNNIKTELKKNTNIFTIILK